MRFPTSIAGQIIGASAWGNSLSSTDQRSLIHWTEQMKSVAVSHLKDPDLQKVPQALMRAAEKARQLAEQTGTPFVTRKPATVEKKGK